MVVLSQSSAGTELFAPVDGLASRKDGTVSCWILCLRSSLPLFCENVSVFTIVARVQGHSAVLERGLFLYCLQIRPILSIPWFQVCPGVFS
jgi:hypothetical protein